MSLSSEWKGIGTLLGVPSDTLKRIKREEESINDRLQEMLQEWLNQVNPEPTWTQLVGVVELFNHSKADEMRHCLIDIPNPVLIS